MSVELRPLGVHCNLKCQYCYQNPQRDAGNLTRSYDLDKMKAAIEAEGGPFCLFGGEPLLVPHQDLEDLWAWGLERFGSNGIQTNGSLIDDRHIAMFSAYRVQVGVSIDGPGELNDIRWHGTLERTRQSTAKTERAIERLCAKGSPPGLIITLHRGNARADRLPKLLDWVRYLFGLGISSIRLHLLESESEAIRQRYALSTEENLAALRAFAELDRQMGGGRFDLFQQMGDLLRARDGDSTCIWHACDPLTTQAVRGVEGQGQRSNCGRTNKDGIDFVKAQTVGYERTLALYHTPQEHGGCKGCRFFLMCKGQCPGTAIDGDWRNRSEHCEIWWSLFEDLEKEMLATGTTPLSMRHDERLGMEARYIAALLGGQNPRMEALAKEVNPASSQSGTADNPPEDGDWRAQLHRLGKDFSHALAAQLRAPRHPHRSTQR